MKNTWHLIALCFVFAILGISVEEVAVPNQEIVIRFTDSSVTLDKTQDAIALVKRKLQSIDANNIRIQETANGTLKITYFSTVDVADIQRIFSDTIGVEGASNIADNNPSPASSDDDGYELGIYKIQDQNNLVDTNGNVLESKSEITRFISIDGAVSFGKLSEKEKTRLEKSAFVLHRSIAIAIDNTSYKIPEVRAGPRV